MATSYLTESFTGPTSARGSSYSYSYESHYDNPPEEEYEHFTNDDGVHQMQKKPMTNAYVLNCHGCQLSSMRLPNKGFLEMITLREIPPSFFTDSKLQNQFKALNQISFGIVQSVYPTIYRTLFRNSLQILKLIRQVPEDHHSARGSSYSYSYESHYDNPPEEEYEHFTNDDGVHQMQK
ncbi:hypothetical protein CRE_30569, partial [Caenorhabditis remanei]